MKKPVSDRLFFRLDFESLRFLFVCRIESTFFVFFLEPFDVRERSLTTVVAPRKKGRVGASPFEIASP